MKTWVDERQISITVNKIYSHFLFLFPQQTYYCGACQHGEHLQSFEGSDCYVFRT